MAESLPLSIDRVYTSPWEISLLDEPLPIDLILVFLARELLSDLKYLNKFSHCKSSSLP